MYKRLYVFIVIVLNLHLTASLHLTTHPTHLQTSTDRISKVYNIINSLNNLNDTLKQKIATLSTTNQTQRISQLQQTIIFTRNKLFKIYIGSIVDLNTTTYYCFPPSPSQQLAIKNTLNSINNNLQLISQISPVNESNCSLQSLTQNSIQLSSFIAEDLAQGGLSTSTIPAKISQPNLIATNLSLGNKSLSDLSKDYQSSTTSFASPYSKGNCIECSNVYDLTSKSCITCKSFNSAQRNCLDQINQKNITQTTRITNINKLQGIILPDNMTLQQYKKYIQNNTQNINLIPCPDKIPFFNGTVCISCPVDQYFSVSISACQTCPLHYTYNSSTYHCDSPNYYSNLKNTKWISIGTSAKTIKQKIKNQSIFPNSKECPQNTPFFNKQTCIGCSNSFPIFSYDSWNCTACAGTAIFNSNLQSCVQAIHKQTSLASPNLILQGRPLNEWKYYYQNNRTADTQLEDCPPSRPYFDGLTCISCPTETPYFNLQYRNCQSCDEGTAYDSSIRECLSTSGNIVSQADTLKNMAASIFA